MKEPTPLFLRQKDCFLDQLNSRNGIDFICKGRYQIGKALAVLPFGERCVPTSVICSPRYSLTWDVKAGDLNSFHFQNTFTIPLVLLSHPEFRQPLWAGPLRSALPPPAFSITCSVTSHVSFFRVHFSGLLCPCIL